MRKYFPDYYQARTKSEVDALWKTAIFSFDTNVLIELFVLSKEAREKWFNIIEKIGTERRWLPYQVAREYHSSVDNVIRDECEGAVSQVHDQFSLASKGDLTPFISKNTYFLGQVSKDALKEFAEVFKTARKNLKTETNKLRKDFLAACESTKKLIAELFDGRVAEPWRKERLYEEHRISLIRRQQAIPPGYADADKKTNIGGDYFIWRELMDYAQAQKRPVIFVTKDLKEDWFIARASDSAKIPRSELRVEMQTESGQDFMLYSFHEFFEEAKIRFGIDTTEEISDEIKNAEMNLHGVDAYESGDSSKHESRNFRELLLGPRKPVTLMDILVDQHLRNKSRLSLFTDQQVELEADKHSED